MKNKILKTFFILLLLVFQFIVIVNAHPGRTDSNGGHYDRSTGEYHYHNGESAGKNQTSKKDSEYNYSDKTNNSSLFDGDLIREDELTEEQKRKRFLSELSSDIFVALFFGFLLSIPIFFFIFLRFFESAVQKHPKIFFFAIYISLFIFILHYYINYE